MSLHTRLKHMLVVAVLAIAGFSAKSYAFSGNPMPLDIHVYISATKSLSVDTTSYAYGGLGVGVAAVSASSITVTNDSTNLVETYRIVGANAASDTSGTNWVLDTSTATPDHYTLAAQFSDAAPANADGSWSGSNNTDLTTTVTTCSDTQFGNGTHAQAGVSVSPTSSTSRALWFRIRTPGIVTDTGGHTALVTLSVL